MRQILPVLCFLILAVSCRQQELPSINILKEGSISWEEKEACRIVYSDAHGVSEYSAGIKFRGGVSSKYYKHSYSLELDQKHSLGNLPADDDWIINAGYIDKTFMRHKISYDLFREMHTKNVAAKSAYVNVKLNDDYRGLYLLMEEVNASMVGLDKSDSMAVLFKDPPIFRKERLSYVKDPSNYYQQKFPKINDADKTWYIEAFKDFLYHSSDAEFAKDVSSWVDIKNVIDWQIILLFSNNGDGVLKNFYLYKIDDGTPFRIAIWDYDHSFGRDGDNEKNMMENALDCNRAILLERLSKIEETGYMTKMKDRWFELRDQDIISLRNFEKHISRNDRIIGPELDRNFELWPIDDDWYYDNNNYHQELELMLEFVALRIGQLDKYFNSI